jgi:hypothetical protein
MDNKNNSQKRADQFREIVGENRSLIVERIKSFRKNQIESKRVQSTSLIK